MGEYGEKGSTVMAKELLDVKQLFVNVEDKEILHGVDLKIGKGETHVLMGPNGAGKSTLGYALMGNPRYQLTNGEIWFQGKKINEEPVDKRAKAGMFLSFQSPLEVPGLSLSSFIRSALEKRRAHPSLGFQKRAGKGNGTFADGSVLCRPRSECGFFRR